MPSRHPLLHDLHGLATTAARGKHYPLLPQSSGSTSVFIACSVPGSMSVSAVHVKQCRIQGEAHGALPVILVAGLFCV